MTELASTITPASKAEILETLWVAYQKYFGSTPKKESIWILASQWATETGWGKFMHAYNVGNVKCREGDGYDHQFYACNEVIDVRTATKHAKADPVHAKITHVSADGAKATIWYYPPHPECRFRAFNSLLDGVSDYIGLLVRRFNKAWPSVIAGDMPSFVHALRLQNYFTADEAAYTKTMVNIFNQFAKVPFDYEKLPMMSAQERTELDQVLELSLSELVKEIVT
jgi:hypothetical protein